MECSWKGRRARRSAEGESEKEKEVESEWVRGANVRLGWNGSRFHLPLSGTLYFFLTNC